MACCTNVGPVDRGFRALLGLGALVTAFVALHASEGAMGGVLLAVFGVVMLGTAAMGFCPAYVPFRASTCPTPPRAS